LASGKQTTADEDRSDEAWIRTGDGERSIRIRSLSGYLGRGGALMDARLHEDKDGIWSMWVRLADRIGEFRLNQFHSDDPKTYVDLTLAAATLRDDFGYFGAVILTTDRRVDPKP